MKEQNNYTALLRNLLSLEFNCLPEDFKKNENVLTVSALNDGRRIYSPEKYFFHMVTLGNNAVITADTYLHPFLHEFIHNRTGHWLFEIPNLLPLEKELNKWNYTLSQTHHMFLPTGTPTIPQTEIENFMEKFTIKYFYDKEINQFYGNERFSNAICPKFLPERPDRIVICSYDGDKLMGMAGCSEDTAHWQQIGIDVMPEYRSRGIGTYLVMLLKNEILSRGDMPFYGTSISNYHSWNIAINCGFKPAWVEIGANRITNNAN